MTPKTADKKLLESVRGVLDRPAGRYREINGARTFGDYLARDVPREDEELLTSRGRAWWMPSTVPFA